MWSMADKVKEIQIVALFNGGHDTLGTELMNSLTDKNFVCNRLVELHVFSTRYMMRRRPFFLNSLLVASFYRLCLDI